MDLRSATAQLKRSLIAALEVKLTDERNDIAENYLRGMLRAFNELDVQVVDEAHLPQLFNALTSAIADLKDRP